MRGQAGSTVVRLAVLAALLAGLILAHTGPVKAGSASATGEASQWFKSLIQPGTTIPCCDISDCHVTQAKWHDGQWWAIVAGAWQAVPPGVVLNRASMFGDLAVVCHGPPPKWSGGVMPPTLFCFVPPNGTS